MNNILLKLVDNLTSRTFWILCITIYLYVNKIIDLTQFLSINGISYGGTSIKDGMAIITAKQVNKEVK